MPYLAPVLCKRSGCRGLVNDGTCTQCGPLKHNPEYERRRGSASKRGYGHNWKKLRRMVLAAKPLCEQCLSDGIIEPAVDVDHIIPKRQGGLDMRENLQSLCHSCHSKKTAGGT